MNLSLKKTIVAYIEGQFAKRLITDEITAWDAGTKTLTFNTDKDVALFENGDIIRQNETFVIGGWSTFNALASNTIVQTKHSAIVQDDTQIYIAIGTDSTSPSKLTYVQKGPITQEGPWVQQTLNNFIVLQAEVFDDVVYLLGNTFTGATGEASIMVSDDGGMSFNQVDLNVSQFFDWSGFAKWNGKYYAAAGAAGLWSADSVEGPYTQDTRFEPNVISNLVITPWGLAISSQGSASSGNRAPHQYILKEDNSIQEITATLSVVMRDVDYRDGQLVFTGTAYSGSNTTLCFIYSSDGVNFTTKDFEYIPAKSGGMTARATLAVSTKPKNNPTADWTLMEFDPIVQNLKSKGITVGQGFGNSTYANGLLMITIGRFRDIYTEGTLAPVGVVDTTQAGNKTITLASTSGDWSANTGNWGIGPIKAGPNTRKYIKHDASGNVERLLDSPQDPVYTSSSAEPTITYKFPNSLDGLSTEEKIKEGSTLFVEGTATNSIGSDGPVTGQVTPQP